MPFTADVGRIIRALNWIGGIALALGMMVVVWALWGTRGVDDFRTAIIIATLGFGLPSVVALALAWLLDSMSSAGAEHGVGPAAPTDTPTPATAQVIEVAAQYGVGLGAIAVATLLRWWLNPFLGVTGPFITFFLAVAVAAWFGGFGPAALATCVAVVIAWNWFLVGDGTLPANQLGNLVALGVFAATALALAGITATMHATSRAARRMTTELAVREAGAKLLETELRRERARTRAAVAAADVPVIVTNAANAIEHMNAAAERLTGWALIDARGVQFERLVRPRDVARGTATPTAGAPAGRTEASVRSVGDESDDRAVEVRFTRLADPGGATFAHVAVLREIAAGDGTAAE